MILLNEYSLANENGKKKEVKNQRENFLFFFACEKQKKESKKNNVKLNKRENIIDY